MKKKIIRIVIIILILVMIVSVFMISRIVGSWNRDARKFTELTEQTGKYPFDDYPEMAGWIKVDGTVIDYPVMLSPDEPERYLRANVDGEYSMSGTPFMDYRCTPDSPNVIIYGHNMHSGAMFYDLSKFEDREFLEKHDTFTFTDRKYETTEYRVFAVIKLDAAEDEELYDVIGGKRTEYDRYAEMLTSRSLYPTGVTPGGGQIMCLSTCSYHTDEGRLMIAGVLQQKKEDDNDNS